MAGGRGIYRYNCLNFTTLPKKVEKINPREDILRLQVL